MFVCGGGGLNQMHPYNTSCLFLSSMQVLLFQSDNCMCDICIAANFLEGFLFVLSSTYPNCHIWSVCVCTPLCVVLFCSVGVGVCGRYVWEMSQFD